MKTVKSEAELKTLALRIGAEAVIGQERFNTSRSVVVAPPPPPPTPPVAPIPAAPPVPLPEYLTREQVESMLAEQEKRLTRQIEMAMAGLQRILEALPARRAVAREWVHDVTLNSDGELKTVRSRAASESS